MARSPESLSGREIAEQALCRLLDRVEVKSDRQNRVIEHLPKVSLLYDDLQDLHEILKRAADEKCVELVYGRRENSHNIEKVVLLDPEPLYRMLGRRKPSDVATVARAALEAGLPNLTPELRGVIERVTAAWSEKRNLIRDLGPDDVEDVIGVFKAAARLLSRSRDDGMDRRTFSRRATGNSKFVENNIGRIADVVRMAVVIPDYLDASNMLEYFGVNRMPHPCLVAGPVTYKGNRLPAEPYIGIAPEMTAHLGVDSKPQWLLTVENLASFNRQVREAATGGVVIYTGGFPSNSALAAIIALARATDCRIYHWGDIDAGGIKIAYRIERALAITGRRLELHLMSPTLAVKHGSPVSPAAVFKDFVDDLSVVADLVRFMGSDEAHLLEQEELEPVIPLPASETAESNPNSN